MTAHKTREAWLQAAVAELRSPLKQVGAVVPDKIAVSVGFNYRNARKTMGVCFPTKASEDKTTQVFISPAVSDPIEVLATLVHELIHASDDGASNHRGHFATCARAIGLEGKLTATHAGDALKECLGEIASDLGAYPHGKLVLGTAVKKQGTRLLKAVCGNQVCPLMDESGKVYTVRVTGKWVEVGMPTCPCGAEMELAV